MGVGKSTQLAAAQASLFADRTFRIAIDHTFDMRRIQAGEVFVHILAKFVEASPNPDAQLKLDLAKDIAGGDKRDFRRDLARRALRATAGAVLLIDGLE